MHTYTVTFVMGSESYTACVAAFLVLVTCSFCMFSQYKIHDDYDVLMYSL